jgi:hypothetical protein
MGHYNHIIRFCILLLVVVIGFLIIRSITVPESFGIYGSYTYGYHRGDSDAEQAAKPVVFQGIEKCQECHEEQFEEWNEGGHVTLACEACHGYWQAHNNNTKDKVLKDTSVESCMLCHRKLNARPEKSSQIVSFTQHMEEQEQEIAADTVCTDCHSPHMPL